MKESVNWQKCLDALKASVDEQSFLQWLRPLQAVENIDELTLYAPNDYVKNAVVERFLSLIQEQLDRCAEHWCALKDYNGAPSSCQDEINIPSHETIQASPNVATNDAGYPMTPGYTIDQFVMVKK